MLVLGKVVLSFCPFLVMRLLWLLRQSDTLERKNHWKKRAVRPVALRTFVALPIVVEQKCVGRMASFPSIGAAFYSND